MIKKRIEWIDALRAVAMLIVMMWHISADCQNQWIYSLCTAPVMIPLFFAITGYIFNDCQGNQKEFLCKLSKYLVYPWLALAFLKGAVNATLRGSFDYLTEYIGNLFTGDNLWYFPCCIIAEIIFFYSLKKCKDSRMIIIQSLFLSVIGVLLSEFKMFNYLNISTAFISQFFIVLGYSLRDYDFRANKKEVVSCSVLYASFVIILAINLLPPPIACYGVIPMDVHRNYFYFAPMCTILIILGTFSIFGVSQFCSRFNKLLLFIGQNTIVFYVFHYDTLLPFNLIMQKLDLRVQSSWGYALAQLAWSIICCSLIAILFNKYMPQMVGKRKHNSINKS